MQLDTFIRIEQNNQAQYCAPEENCPNILGTPHEAPWEENKKYKLRLNICVKQHTKENCTKISEIIADCLEGYKSDVGTYVFTSFKHTLFGNDIIFKPETNDAYNLYQFFSVLKNDNRKSAENVLNNLDKDMRVIYSATCRRVFSIKDFFDGIHEENEDLSVYKNYLREKLSGFEEYYKMVYESCKRMVGIFTFYIPFNLDENLNVDDKDVKRYSDRLINFFELLAKKLNENNFKPGNITNMDVPINEFFSFRQARLNGEYIDFTACPQIQKKIKEEAKASSFYKYLRSHLSNQNNNKLSIFRSGDGVEKQLVQNSHLNPR